MKREYIGRFAPSPTGPLHAGSVVAALASYLDARAHGGRWLLRIEDIDTERCKLEYIHVILRQLAALQLHPDGPVLLQSIQTTCHASALERLRSAGLAYPCACSRQRITAAHAPIGASGEAVYPGFCRQRLSGATARLWRARVPAQRIDFEDRWMGAQSQQLDTECGDFALRRADGPFSYHLACVADDAASGITDVVRGADLISVTPRQIWLQSALGLSTPRYLHVPVITNPLGQKLSKQTGATAVDTTQPMAALQRAWQHLGFCAIAAQDVPGFFAQATAQWARRFNPD